VSRLVSTKQQGQMGRRGNAAGTTGEQEHMIAEAAGTTEQ